MRARASRPARVALATVVFALVFAFTATAFAASTYYDQYPGVNGTCTEAMPRIAVKVSDPAGISGSPQIKIDGVSKSAKIKWGPGNAYAEIYYQVPSALSNGTHTVYASIFTGAGRTSTTWTFNERIAPAVGPLAPADGSTVDTQKPTISAVVNTAAGATLASYTMTVDGAGVVPGYDAGTKTISYTPTMRLANDRNHTASLTVVDTTGGSTTVTWSFHVQVFANMVDTGGCTECHTGYPASHPMTNCDGCHAINAPFYAYWNMDNPSQYAHESDYLMGIDCAYCHSSQFTEVPQHPANIGDAHQTATDMSGCACHVADLTIEHNRYTTAEGAAITCASCHNSSDPQVQAGMALGTKRCPDCHTIPAGHPYGSIDHVADVAETPLATSGKKCGDCHEMDLLTEHDKSSSSSAGQSCGTCHEFTDGTGPADKLDAWNQTCSQSECHVAGSTTEIHAGLSTAHLPPTNDCTSCHEVTDVASLHSEATTTVAGITYTACSVCHRAGINPTKDCVACHPDRTAPHGYDPADHTAAESCIGSCHTAAAGLTDLKPLHDAAKGSSVTCTACHATLVPGFAEQYPAGWDKTCTNCHPIADLHPAAATQHTGDDASYYDASFMGNGCTAIEGHTQMIGCHNISNVAVVHAKMSANGCPACHGEGKTPSSECLDCHKPGSATSYVRPGEPSASIFATPYPNADNFMTPGWTYTTTPAGEPVWNVVNSVYPPANTTRYVTVTSNTAGGFLWGFAPQSIPANARITDVRIYAKAKATNTTYPRKMQGVFKIGGTTYLGTPQSGNLSTIWTAGMGTSFGSTSTRIDYTREPLYGEMIWRNPKTGQDWTPDEINGTDPDSSLEAFGVNLTGSTAANNVSFAQIFVRVTYYTVGPSVTYPTVGTHTYHIDNVKYLHDKSDVPAGQRFAVAPAHGWYDALCYQDCYDFCHRGEGGVPTFSANQGTWMWYSVGGDPYDSYTLTRKLTLREFTIPAESPVLTFDTNWRLGSGASGTVEISTDGGTNWTALTGTVGGSSLSSLTGSATGWVNASYDLSAYAGQKAKIRFRYVNGSSTSEGWAFDSLSLSGTNGAVFTDNAETLKPDWDNSFWTRSMGAFPMR